MAEDIQTLETELEEVEAELTRLRFAWPWEERKIQDLEIEADNIRDQISDLNGGTNE